MVRKNKQSTAGLRGLGVHSTHEEWRFPKTLRKSVARGDWVNILMIIIGWSCYLAAAFMASMVVYFMIHNEQIQASVSKGVLEAVQQWPADSQRSQYNMAKEYNSDLGNLTRRPLGDIVNEKGVTVKNDDTQYMNALNVQGSGAMGVLKIPSISSEMTVYHTTNEQSLSNGVGHVYGTYLPIKEKGSLTALAAHSGGVNGLFFTRLGQLKVGDYFYFTTLGSEQAFQVETINTVLPEDLGDELKSQYNPNDVRVSLITCTPVGVNTHRLVVTGSLREVPDTAPPAEQVVDGTTTAIIIGVLTFITFIIIAFIFKYIQTHMPGKYRLRPDEDEAQVIMFTHGTDSGNRNALPTGNTR